MGINLENSNKNGQSSHWGLLEYDNIQWKSVLDETNMSIIKLFSKPQGPHSYIYIYFKILNTIVKCTH